MKNLVFFRTSILRGFNVLRTYRRAAGGERKAESESQHEFPAAIHASCLQKRCGSSLEHLTGHKHAERAEHQRRVAAIPDSTMSKNV